jgi:hypothetical protein
MFVRRFIVSFNILEMCIGTMKPFFQPMVTWCSLSSTGGEGRGEEAVVSL